MKQNRLVVSIDYFEMNSSFLYNYLILNLNSFLAFRVTTVENGVGCIVNDIITT